MKFLVKWDNTWKLVSRVIEVVNSDWSFKDWSEERNGVYYGVKVYWNKAFKADEERCFYFKRTFVYKFNVLEKEQEFRKSTDHTVYINSNYFCLLDWIIRIE